MKEPPPHLIAVISTFPPVILYLIAFVEGASVMAVELASARLIEPFYGSSLYVWSAVLSTTLGGLMIGYFTGGLLSKRNDASKVLLLTLGLAALLVIAMPLFSRLIMESTLGMEMRAGILISCLLFLTPSLICFGMVTPLLIRLAVRSVEESGKITGTVYAVSTTGGILATFAVGFYTIPWWGLKMSLYFTGGLIGLLPVIAVLSRKKS